MVLDRALIAVMALNALWCGAGFWFFTIRAPAAVRVLLPRKHRDDPLVEHLVGSVRFLGGLNLALATLAAAAWLWSGAFPDPGVRAMLCAVFVVGHGSQFALNFPIAVREYRGQPTPWRVLSGTMQFIFVVDGLLTIANAVCLAFFSLN